MYSKVLEDMKVHQEQIRIMYILRVKIFDIVLLFLQKFVTSYIATYKFKVLRKLLALSLLINCMALNWYG